MATQQGRRKKKKRRNRFGFFHYILLIGLIYVVVVFWKQEKMLSELEAKKEESALELTILQKDVAELEKEIQESDSLKFVEKVAREELRMVKPREIIYIDKNKMKKSFFDRD